MPKHTNHTSGCDAVCGVQDVYRGIAEGHKTQATTAALVLGAQIIAWDRDAFETARRVRYHFKQWRTFRALGRF